MAKHYDKDKLSLQNTAYETNVRPIMNLTKTWL